MQNSDIRYKYLSAFYVRMCNYTLTFTLIKLPGVWILSLLSLEESINKMLNHKVLLFVKSQAKY